MIHRIVLQLSNGKNVGTFDFTSTAPVPRIGEAVGDSKSQYIVRMVFTSYPDTTIPQPNTMVYTVCEVEPIS